MSRPFGYLNQNGSISVEDTYTDHNAILVYHMLLYGYVVSSSSKSMDCCYVECEIDGHIYIYIYTAVSVSYFYLLVYKIS